MKVYKRVVNLLVLVLHLVKGVELGEKSSITKNINVYLFGLNQRYGSSLFTQEIAFLIREILVIL